jgi:hypothetical protein
MRTRWLCLLLLSTVLVPAFEAAAAEGPDPRVAEALGKLDFLLGRWEGEGSFSMGPGEPKTVHITEHVNPNLDGMALLMEGHGVAPDPETGGQVTVHNALGLVSYDPGAERYLLRAINRQGLTIDVAPEVDEGRLVWGFEAPRAGRFRYTVTLDKEGRWHEIGEINREGDTWTQFFEMTLTRTGDP